MFALTPSDNFIEIIFEGNRSSLGWSNTLMNADTLSTNFIFNVCAGPLIFLFDRLAATVSFRLIL